ncbi:MAG: hypothetical protein ABEL51_09800 [Salinibacter sp.]
MPEEGLLRRREHVVDRDLNVEVRGGDGALRVRLGVEVLGVYGNGVELRLHEPGRLDAVFEEKLNPVDEGLNALCGRRNPDRYTICSGSLCRFPMVVEISKSGGIELKPGCRDDPPVVPTTRYEAHFTKVADRGDYRKSE